MSTTTEHGPEEEQAEQVQAEEAQAEEVQAEEAQESGGGAFSVRLKNFEGPFDLLLQLISKHKLDITEVALSQVTDEFIAHIKAAGDAWDLEQTSQFIVVAATLLDLKAARLLPSGEVEDAEDLALLEARDLLFARLLQYRAFKEIAARFSDRLDAQARRYPRQVALEPRFAQLLPEITIKVSLQRFAELAARAMAPKEAEVLSLSHLHAPQVSVREQAVVVTDRLKRARQLTFKDLTEDSPDRLTTVCRFLALLELFRERAVIFEQPRALGELIIRWSGSEDQEVTISDEFDVPPQEQNAAGQGDGDRGEHDQVRVDQEPVDQEPVGQAGDDHGEVDHDEVDHGEVDHGEVDQAADRLAGQDEERDIDTDGTDD